MKLNLSFITNTLFLIICAYILIQSLASLLRRKPLISSERNFIWFFLALFVLPFIDRHLKESEWVYTSIGIGFYLLVALIIVGLLVAAGKVSYGYIIGGVDAEPLSQAISSALAALKLEFTWYPPNFNLPTINSVLEVKYSRWWRAARLRIQGAGNQKLLNEIVRSLKEEHNSLLGFNKRSALIEGVIGLGGLVLGFSQLIF